MGRPWRHMWIILKICIRNLPFSLNFSWNLNYITMILLYYKKIWLFWVLSPHVLTSSNCFVPAVWLSGYLKGFFVSANIWSAVFYMGSLECAFLGLRKYSIKSICQTWELASDENSTRRTEITTTQAGVLDSWRACTTRGGRWSLPLSAVLVRIPFPN